MENSKRVLMKKILLEKIYTIEWWIFRIFYRQC